MTTGVKAPSEAGRPGKSQLPGAAGSGPPRGGGGEAEAKSQAGRLAFLPLLLYYL